jgi:hypothetical protein
VKQKYRTLAVVAGMNIYAALIEINSNSAVAYSDFIPWRNWMDYMKIEV